MGTLGTLAVSIVGDASGLNKTLDGAQRKFQDTGKRVGKMGGTITRNVTLPLLAIGGAIGGAMIKYGNFADQMLDLSAITGMSTDELQKWRDVAVDAGVDVDASAKAMERFNKRLERGADISPALEEGIHQMNMSVEEFRELDADEKMRAMVQQMADMDDQERVAFANKMNIPELLPMVEEVIERGGDVEEVLGDIDPAFSEEDLETMDEFRQSWDNLKESIFLLIGEALMPLFEWFKENREMIEGKFKDALEGIGDTIGRLVEWWQNLAPGMQDFIKRAVVIAAVLGPILIVVGKVIAIIGAVLPVLKAVGAAIMLLTSPIGLIIAAVIGLAYLIYTYWDEIKEYTISAWESIKEFFIGLWESIKDIAVNVWNSIVDFFKEWGELILAVILGPVGLIAYGIREYWDEIVEFTSNLWEGIKDFFINIWESITSIFSGATSGLFDGIKERFTAVKDWLADTWETIREWFEGIWDSISGVFDMSLSEIWETIKGWFFAYHDFIEDLMGDVDAVIGDLWDSAKDKVLTAAKAIYDGVKEWFTSLKDTVWGVIKGMVNSVIGLFNSMINRLNKLSISIPDWVPVWGGRDFSPGIPNIPELASGGNIQKAGWAMVGERGPEVLHLPEGAKVSPLSGQEMRHSGTIRIEGINDAGQLEAVKDIIIDELRREVRG